MPFIAYAMYQGWFVVAFFAAMLIAGTDYLDGYLARKYGPTVLGGLLDPIADKVFLALLYVPLADLGILPEWLVIIMFVREFLVTAMRSAYAYRGLSFQTSYLAKIKTWVQMQAMGTFLFLLITPYPWTWVSFGIQMGIPLSITLWIRFRKKRNWRAGWIATAFTALSFAMFIVLSLKMYMTVGMIVVTGLTWASGFDYLVTGLPQLSAKKRWSRTDGIRVITAGFLPVLTIGWLTTSSVSPAPLLSIVALELAVGGLDNLLAHHRVYSRAIIWGSRTVLVLAAVGAGWTFSLQGTLFNSFALAASALCLVGVVWEFVRGRNYYLGTN